MGEAARHHPKIGGCRFEPWRGPAINNEQVALIYVWEAQHDGREPRTARGRGEREAPEERERGVASVSAPARPTLAAP